MHHIPPQPYAPILTLSALLSCSQWPLLSVLAQADCNYQTGGTSRLINTLTSRSRLTRAYSTAKRGSDNFIPHLSPGTHTDVHLCVCAFVCVLPGAQQGPPLLYRGGEWRCWWRAAKLSTFCSWDWWYPSVASMPAFWGAPPGWGHTSDLASARWSGSLCQAQPCCAMPRWGEEERQTTFFGSVCLW